MDFLERPDECGDQKHQGVVPPAGAGSADRAAAPRRKAIGATFDQVSMATVDQMRLDEFRQLVQMWAWVLDSPNAVDFVRQANLDVVRNQIHRERAVLIELGAIHQWTMDRSRNHVLPKLDTLIGNRDNRRGIFAEAR